MSGTLDQCDICWWSHGCDLPNGHEGRRHICGAYDPDGACSSVAMVDGVWVVQVLNDDDNWEGDRPGGPFSATGRSAL